MHPPVTNISKFKCLVTNYITCNATTNGTPLTYVSFCCAIYMYNKTSDSLDSLPPQPQKKWLIFAVCGQAIVIRDNGIKLLWRIGLFSKDVIPWLQLLIFYDKLLQSQRSPSISSLKYSNLRHLKIEVKKCNTASEIMIMKLKLYLVK